LSQHPDVYGLIFQEIHRVNASLHVPLRVKQFVLLHKELDPDDAEITRTRKLRRRFVYDKYQEIVDAMYTEAEPEVKVRATVTYEDGRTSEIERSLRIGAVGDGGA
jgi:long-chain acyl-CoA synthetase